MPNRFASALHCAALCCAALCCAALAASGAALAETAPAAGALPSKASPTVTVHAPPAPKLIRKLTSRFVYDYAATPNPNIEHIVRWRDPVCIMILGLPLPDQAARIKARIQGLAATVGLPPARPDCKPNVEIAFEDDPQHQMDGVAKRLEPMLGYYHLSQTRQLKTVTHPIQAWYVTATTSDGVNTAALISSGLRSTYYQAYNDLIDDPETLTPTGCANRVTDCYQGGFRNILIVADNKALTGVKLGAVADDLAMLALSQPKSQDGCNALPSIIDRFARAPCAGRAAPDGLTPSDKAYLTALYSADLENRKGSEETDIADRMADILIRAEAPAAP